VICALARQDGERWVGLFGKELGAIEKVAALWADGGALEIDMLGQLARHLDFNVTRCCYAELYQELGLAGLGNLFHCERDSARMDCFSEDIVLKRSQTIMAGARFCDFRFERIEAK
jgi:hypothetical protein